MTRHYVTDAYGVTRSGPRGAWWAWLTPADHGDVPAGRARAWNVAAVLFAAGDLYMAHRFGVLGWILAIVAGLIAATGGAIVLTQRRIDRQGAERLAAFRAAHAARPVHVELTTERAERPERVEVAR